MIVFVSVLRVFASCLITNSHYEAIYPFSFLGNGGLLGNSLFFALSGYCLYIKKNSLTFKGFLIWYIKRIIRLYVPFEIVAVLLCLLGYYAVSKNNCLELFLFSNTYVFIPTMAFLDIPFYFAINIPIFRKNLNKLLVVLLCSWLFVYIFIYDKSYYHIDNIREPMILFLYFESMLVGAMIRQKDNQIRNHFKKHHIVYLLIFGIAYAACKTMLVKGLLPSQLQFINQILLFSLTGCLFLVFSGIDGKLGRLSRRLISVINCLSSITLEVYLVQFYIISQITAHSIPFPINWIVTTVLIILGALVLNKVTLPIIISGNKLIDRMNA